ncbi:anti-sigma factor [Paenibacillus thermotolerans]|uniref:anti-sigma factor n=1 Tax=Paenibacillus thermotolerans TaxID=3027807 RepID=UPI0023681FA0|nr:MULTISPECIES: anti-sigma factor [unclassified Paenibacillus]
MPQHRHPACELLIDVVSGQCTPSQREQFTAHLDACPSCSDEYAGLRDIWDHLYLAQEELELPASLKGDVLSSIFEPGRTRSQSIARRRYSKRLFWIPAAVVLLLITSINGYFFYETRQTAPAALNEPAKVIELFRLTASGTGVSFDGYGVACIVERSGKRELIVYSYGLPRTEGDQAYQVWLLRDGIRTNAGTFHVEEDGFGVLTYPLGKSIGFDRLGITLEPDANGSEPRGKKVLGS